MTRYGYVQLLIALLGISLGCHPEKRELVGDVKINKLLEGLTSSDSNLRAKCSLKLSFATKITFIRSDGILFNEQEGALVQSRYKEIMKNHKVDVDWILSDEEVGQVAALEEGTHYTFIINAPWVTVLDYMKDGQKPYRLLFYNLDEMFVEGKGDLRAKVAAKILREFRANVISSYCEKVLFPPESTKANKVVCVNDCWDVISSLTRLQRSRLRELRISKIDDALPEYINLRNVFLPKGNYVVYSWPVPLE